MNEEKYTIMHSGIMSLNLNISNSSYKTPMNYYAGSANITQLVDTIIEMLKTNDLQDLIVSTKKELKFTEEQLNHQKEILMNLSEQLNESEQININNANNILNIISELENNLEQEEFLNIIKASKTLDKIYSDSSNTEWLSSDESDDEDVYIKGNN